MEITFYKYQGTGNDFVIIDNRQAFLPTSLSELAQQLCARHVSIGADGLVVLQSHRDYDFAVHCLNADGSQYLCANGNLCATHLAHHLNIIGRQGTLLTIDGPHQVAISKNGIQLTMHNVTEVQNVSKGYFVDNGSHHYVQFVDSLNHINIIQEGRAIRYDALFQPLGVNVNFVQKVADNRLAMRTYERGVENETLSCGTGAVAVALAASRQGYLSPIELETQGGILRVSFHALPNGSFQDITLTGTAQMVFRGTICLAS